jgi:ATP-binding cassette subfamily B protein
MSENTRFEEKEYAARFDIRVWRKLLSYTTGLFPTIGALVVFMVIVALVDGIFPQMTRYAIDRIVPELGSPSAAQKIARFAALFGALALAQGLNVFLFICIAGTVEVRVCHALRRARVRSATDP